MSGIQIYTALYAAFYIACMFLLLGAGSKDEKYVGVGVSVGLKLLFLMPILGSVLGWWG